MDPFVLLDDAPAGRATLLTELARVDEVALDGLDDALAAGWAEGWHCFVRLPYELGPAGADAALFWFARSAPAQAPDAGHAWLTGLEHDVSERNFGQGVAAIREAIAAGTSYQVNYTHRVTGRLIGEPGALYGRLRERQPVAFGVLAHLPSPASPWTLSLSPELFLSTHGEAVTARPMKGTAPADTDPAALAADPKNRAENLMIVDLLRNDLSRVAVPGTIATRNLFEVERVGALWQMTSTVTARMARGTTPASLLTATFPCGSITGAPKLASMDLIRRLEQRPRGVYTGALGLIEPTADSPGWRMRLSVAIRTLEIDEDGAAAMGVGSGIVADSDAASEWAECRAKADFLRLEPTVVLKEAIRVIDANAPLAARHRARLADSARRLGFPAPGGLIDAAVAGSPPGRWRLGIAYRPDGVADVERSPLPDRPPGPVDALLASTPWPVGGLAGHKSSDRAHLDAAWREAAASGAFDTIGYDTLGRVLEGGRSTVFALLDDGWVTAPLTLGVLPGVQRAAVLADPSLIGASSIAEISFSVAELRGARQLVLTNAVHGMLPARLRDTSGE